MFDIGKNSLLANSRFYQSHTETNGMQLSRVHKFSNSEKEEIASDQRESQISFSYGARYFRMEDTSQFRFGRTFFGDFWFDTVLDNQILGPQFSINWQTEQHGWNLEADSSIMLGQNITDSRQVGAFGHTARPDGLNEAVVVQPNTINHNKNHQDFTTIAEANVQATYDLSKTIGLRLGYTALYISDLRYAENSVRWSLPDSGLINNSESTFINGLHASVEWRR